jgi:CRISPR-associated endonuclease/helicase Cas3
VRGHLQGTAELAAEFADNIGLPIHGIVTGLLHDLGKYSDSFQRYIAKGENCDETEKVDHSTAGAQFIWHALGGSRKSAAVGQALALCVASHHGGLIDCVTPEGEDQFGARMRKGEDGCHSQSACGNADEEVLAGVRQLLTESQLVQDFIQRLKAISEREKTVSGPGAEVTASFMGGLLIRVLYSCLIDADRTDTAKFERPLDRERRPRGNYPPWTDLIRRLELHLETFENRSKLDLVRRQVSDACLEASGRDPGFFTLTVPTGGGKTLASLRFALHHAQKYELDRVIYVVPYTTIIEQNARVVREILEPGDVGECSVLLEHHSNLAPERETYNNRLLSENWDAPIIYTTMVQVLEALFGSGTRNVRRLHQMARSVLVFDEIQTLPVRTVHLFCNAVRFLVEHCGSSAVLCTATQPLLGEVDRTKGHLPLTPDNEIIRDVGGLFRDLKRVEIVDRRKAGGWSAIEVADLARRMTVESGSCLVVVNTKRAAREVYELIRAGGEATAIYHLSTNMCPVHRLSVLSQVERRIGKGGKAPVEPGSVICVSTQLIEAGVDIDFGSVIRYAAGLDSIAQAAGRCNRHQRRERGHVVVVNPAKENLDRLEDIRQGRESAIRVLGEYSDSPESFGRDLLGPTAMSRYFQYYFFERRKIMDYPISGERDDNLLNMLSKNVYAESEYRRRNSGTPSPYWWRQSFGSAAREFEAIDTPARGVVVPFGEEGRCVIAELCSTRKEQLAGLLRRAQRYSVNVFPDVFKDLSQQGALYEAQKEIGIYCLIDRYYSEDFGLSVEAVSSDSFLSD